MPSSFMPRILNKVFREVLVQRQDLQLACEEIVLV